MSRRNELIRRLLSGLTDSELENLVRVREEARPIPAAVVRPQSKFTELCSSAAVLSQSKPTELCSSAAVVPQSKSTEK